MEFGNLNNLKNLNSLGSRKVFNVRDLGPSLYLDPTRQVYSDAAADFNDANSEYLSHPDSIGGDFDFGSGGGTSFSIGCWVEFDSINDGNNYAVWSKYDTGGNNRGIALWYGDTAGALLFAVIPEPGTYDDTYAASIPISNISTGVKYYVLCDFNVSTGVRRIQMYTSADGSLVDSDIASSTSTGLRSSSEDFRIGTMFISGSANWFLDGMIDEMIVTKRILTSEETTTLVNEGEGVSWSDIEGTSLDDENLVAYWGLDEKSGTRADSSDNGHHLTDNNTVGVRDGVVSGLAEDDNDVVSLVTNLSGNGNDLTSPALTNYPTLNITSNISSLQFDGTDDYLSASFSGTAGNGTVVIWVKRDGTNTSDFQDSSIRTENATSTLGATQFSIKSGNYVCVYTNSTSDNNEVIFGALTTEWTMYALTVDGTNWKTFVDGDLANTAAETQGIFFDSVSIGMNRNSDLFLSGEIGTAIIIEGKAVSDTDIKKVYNATKGYYGK